MKSINTSEITKELLKNTGIIAIGQISTKIINFVLLPLYTNILTTVEYGLVDLLTTYASFIAVIVGLQINSAVFRFLVTSRQDESTLSNVCSTCFFFELLCCVIYTILFIIVQPVVSLNNKWFLLNNVIVTVYLNFFSGVTRGLGLNKLYSFANFMSAAITLVCNVISIAILHLGVEAMLISYIIGPFVGATVLLLKSGALRYINKSKFSKETLRTIRNYAVPLVPNEISWSLLHSSDRMIITQVIGVASNGLIAVASKFSNIYTTMFSVFNASWTEQVVLHYKDRGGSEYICQMFDRMLCLFGGGAIIIITSMPFVYDIFIPNREYHNAYNLIPVYIIAVFFNAIIGLISAIYTVENATKKVALTTAVAAAINILVDLLLIGVIGVYAAPVSSLCGYLVISIWRLADVNKKYCKIYMKKQKVVALILILIISLFVYWNKNVIVQIILSIAIIFSIITLNREFVRMIFQILLKKVRL